MTPRLLRARIVLERVAWIRGMLDSMRELPARTFEEFTSDKRNVASAESYLRRGLEALLDLGRHLLAKGFGDGVVEYKEIAARLQEKGVISPEVGVIFTDMAGYRNRLTHFYDEVTPEELYRILTHRLDDIENVLEAILGWLRNHPEKMDTSL